MRSFLLIQVPIYSLLFCIGTSCTQSKKKEKSADFTSIRKTLQIPEELSVYKPFMEYQMNESEITSAKYKIYSIMDVSCGSCIGDITLWNEFNKQLEQYDIPIILVCSAVDDCVLFEYLFIGKVLPIEYTL
jgi:hypothetical protein